MWVYKYLQSDKYARLKPYAHWWITEFSSIYMWAEKYSNMTYINSNEKSASTEKVSNQFQ